MANNAPNVATGTGYVSPHKTMPARPKPKGKGHHPPDRTTHVPTPAPNPYDLTTGGTNLSPAAVRAAVLGAANVKYGQPILQTKQNIAASQQRSDVDIPAWYQNYITLLNTGRDQARTEYANAATASTANPTPTGDPTVDAAAQIRAGTQNSFADMIRGQGANTLSNIETNVVPNAGLMQIGSLQGEARNRQNLKQNLGELRGEKGDYANTVLSNMRQQYQTFTTNQEAAQAAAMASGGRLQLAQNEFDYKQQQDQNKRDPSTGLRYGEEKGMSRADLLAAAHAWKSANHINSPHHTAPEKPYSSGAFAGKTPSWVLGHPGKSQALVDAYRQQKGGGISPARAHSFNNQWKSANQYLNDFGARSLSELMDLGNINDYDIANAAFYKHSHGGKITQAMAKALRADGIKVKSGQVEYNQPVESVNTPGHG